MCYLKKNPEKIERGGITKSFPLALPADLHRIGVGVQPFCGRNRFDNITDNLQAVTGDHLDRSGLAEVLDIEARVRF